MNKAVKLFAATCWLFSFGAAVTAQEASLTVQRGHSWAIAEVTFSHDDKLALTSGNEGGTNLWQVETGRLLKRFNNSGISGRFSPDGKYILTAGAATILWETATLKEIRRFLPELTYTQNVVFAPDGRKILIAHSGQVSLCDVKTGNKIKTFRIFKDDAYTRIEPGQIAFSPDGKYFLTSGDHLILWSLQTFEPVRVLSEDRMGTVSFSRDAKTVLAAAGKTAKVYETETGNLVRSYDLKELSAGFVALSPDGKKFLAGSFSGISVFDSQSAEMIHSFKSRAAHGESAFSSDGKLVLSGDEIWNVETKERFIEFKSFSKPIWKNKISPDGQFLLTENVSWISLWNLRTGQEIRRFKNFFQNSEPAANETAYKHVDFSPKNNLLLVDWRGNASQINPLTNKSVSLPVAQTEPVESVYISPDEKFVIYGSKIYDALTQTKIFEFDDATRVANPTFSPDKKYVLFTVSDKNYSATKRNCQYATLILWNLEQKKQERQFECATNIRSTTFSIDSKTVLVARFTDLSEPYLKSWDVETGTEEIDFKGHKASVYAAQFSPTNERIAASASLDGTARVWDALTGYPMGDFSGHEFYVTSLSFTADGNYVVTSSTDNTTRVWDVNGAEEICQLVSFEDGSWVVTRDDGRFDTNNLEGIRGLHWIISDNPLRPLSLEVFMRQYYEPGLFSRTMKCREDDTCAQEFKPLPPIAEINRVRPKVEITEIKPKSGFADTVDITVEVENVTEEITRGGKKENLSSGVFDLRLFRDGQLVGSSTPEDRLAEFIGKAPQLIEQGKAENRLTNLPEDIEWRKANDLAKVVKFDRKMAKYVFENVRLPQDGRKEIEFSAYAFNADRVKSDTFRKPHEIESPKTRQGSTYIISVGVNASQNKNYNLNYAANDARITQRILGEKLKTRFKDNGAKLIQIPLISDYDRTGKVSEKTAAKPFIKAVFDLLAGKKSANEGILEQIPVSVDGVKLSSDEIKKLAPVQPEDTLIITYSGHGYADRSGIFYLLPYDVGENTLALTTSVLPNLISSDELSLWMRDITAREMLMIVDACHSSAAVQGDGFKPGPMGSRGLGQLAFDKGMKILSATQADNVALETGALKQGLLSYALFEDGINLQKADSSEPKDKKVFTNEWLGYGEKRVPELYEDIKNGTFKNVKINGKKPDIKARTDIICEDDGCKRTVQQPKLFDFNKNRTDSLLLTFP